MKLATAQVFDRLREAIHSLSLPWVEQVKLLPPTVPLAYELADDFDTWCRVVLQGAELSTEQRAGLESLDTLLDQLDNGQWSSEALKSSPEWEEIRVCSNALLDQFGWTEGFVTVEQLWHMSNSPYELLRGKLIDLPRYRDGTHGNILSRLSSLLTEYVIETDNGEAYAANAGFVLSRHPDTVFGPDAACVSQAKLHKLAQEEVEGMEEAENQFVPLVPDVVFELTGIDESVEQLAAKANHYLGFGVPLVVVIDSRKRQLHVHRPDAEVAVIECGETFDCGERAPGLLIDTERLFRGI